MTREELIQERDRHFAKFLTDLQSDMDKETLKKQFDKIVETTFQVDAQKGLEEHNRAKMINSLYAKMSDIFSTKKLRTNILIFLLGVVITLIPTLIYTNAIKNNGVPEWRFTPNVIAQDKKPTELEKITTPERLKVAQTADILNKKDLKLGSYISVNPSEGLIVILGNQGVRFENITPHKTNVISGDYTFTPNMLRFRDPRRVELITSTRRLEIAKHSPFLKNDNSLELGAAIAKSQDGYYAIPKEKIKTAFVVKELSDLNKVE